MRCECDSDSDSDSSPESRLPLSFHYGYGYQLVAFHPGFRFRIQVQPAVLDAVPFTYIPHIVLWYIVDSAVLMIHRPAILTPGPWYLRSTHSCSSNRPRKHALSSLPSIKQHSERLAGLCHWWIWCVSILETSVHQVIRRSQLEGGVGGIPRKDFFRYKLRPSECQLTPLQAPPRGAFLAYAPHKRRGAIAGAYRNQAWPSEAREYLPGSYLHSTHSSVEETVHRWTGSPAASVEASFHLQKSRRCCYSEVRQIHTWYMVVSRLASHSTYTIQVLLQITWAPSRTQGNHVTRTPDSAERRRSSASHEVEWLIELIKLVCPRMYFYLHSIM